jgi:hypothetical protein
MSSKSSSSTGRTGRCRVLHLPARWEDFYVTNSLVVVVGIVGVKIAPEYPAVALGFPALMLINGTLMHVLPFLLKRGRFSPGLITSILLFWPIGYFTMTSTELSVRTLVVAFVVGAGMLATPIGFILLKRNAYFDQTRAV